LDAFLTNVDRMMREQSHRAFQGSAMATRPTDEELGAPSAKAHRIEKATRDEFLQELRSELDPDRTGCRALEIVVSTGAIVPRDAEARPIDLDGTSRTAKESLPITAEFAKDVWGGDEAWTGFHYNREFDGDVDMTAGEYFVRVVLGINALCGEGECVYVEHVDPKRTTLWPPRTWFEGSVVSKSKLAMVKRASGLIMKRAAKGTLCAVKFAHHKRDCYHPNMIYVGWDKHSKALVGAVWRGDQNYYFWGDRLKKDKDADKIDLPHV
jgi:hypothetical protein